MPSPNRLIIPNRNPLWKPSGLQLQLEPTHPLTSRLVQAYIFNERGGTPRSLVNPNHKITLGSGVTWINTQFGPALNFNNSANGQAILTQGFTPSATSFSVEMMVRIAVTPVNLNYEYLLGSQAAAGDGLLLTTDTGKGIAGWDFDTSTSDLNTTTNRTLNVWYHVVWVYVSSSSATIYENGVNVASGALGGTFTTPLGWIGYDGTNAPSQFGGDMAWLRIWDNRALTQNEVIQLYTDPFSMVTPESERVLNFAILGGFVSGSTAVSVSDSATGSESVSITAQLPVSDSSAGTESVTITASFSLSDSAAGGAEAITIGMPVVDSATTTETIALNASLSLSDSATGTDTPSVTAQVPASDTGSGTDTPTINVTIPLNDSAAASDAILVSSLITVSDTGSGADVPTVTANISITDSATGTEVQSITVSFNVTDSGTASDSVSVNTGGGTSIGVSDSATGTDTTTISAQVPTTDAGAGSDTPAITANVTGTDSGAGADASQITANISATDSATGTQTVAVPTILVSILDNATGVETQFISVTVPIADAGVGGTSLFVGGSTVFVNVADSAVGADAVLRLAMSGRAVPIALMSGPGGTRAIVRGVGAKRELLSGPSIGSHRVVMRGD